MKDNIELIISEYTLGRITKEKAIKELLNLHSVSKSDVTEKYYNLRQKCEDAVYGDPDGETDQTEILTEIVCREFEIM